MKLKLSFAFLLAAILAAPGLFAQDAVPQNWFNLDPTKDGVPGVGTESIYKRLPAGRKGQPVIVAVIDGGVDYKHEDLKDVMWVNPKEIAGNGIDDDNNGYIDDIHGWNFIGNAKGENIHYDNLEVTRLYVQLRKKYDGVDGSKLTGADKKEFEQYEEYKNTVESNRKKNEEQLVQYEGLKKMLDDLIKALGTDEPTLNELKTLKLEDPRMNRVKQVFVQSIEGGASFKDVAKQITEPYDYYYSNAKYNFNPDFEPRSLVGDNYNDLTQRSYGNPDVKGPDARHGTHVAGIIGAVRGNKIGMDGVADNVRIMAIRTVPDGDERDKDVANSIRYAVDNGATVINMSFGKGQSPHKEVVYEAIKYALKKDVLLIHAAGNDGKENTGSNNYPNDKFSKKRAKNWIEVGALSPSIGDRLAADFSNYSGSLVDVFAPGVEIYSTTPENTYENLQGTSMAAPVVAGIAAVIRSHFPDLTATQVKEVMTGSVIKQDMKVVKPGTEDEMVAFSTLSTSGGIANLEKAVELAAKTPGKKKGTPARSIKSASELTPKDNIRP
jgi:subtilisin family serine protease